MNSYPELYQKSILLEVINLRNPGEIVSAFTLTIPPDQFEVVQSQRITRTKTFGGVFQDDYGLDTAKISISGTTGNNDLRATYIPGKGGALEEYSGKAAIYVLRDRIGRYKNLLAGKGFENYEMRLYDLSTLPNTRGMESIQSTATDGWIVSLDDFKISRSKDRPLWYSYSIELTGIAPLPLVRPKAPSVMDQPPEPTGESSIQSLQSELNEGKDLIKVPTSKDWLQDAISTLRRCVNAVKNAYSWSANLINSIDNVFATIDDLENLTVEYIHASGNLLTSGFGFYNKLFEIAKFPGSLAVATVEEVNDLMNEIEDTMEYTAAIQEVLGEDYDYVVQVCEETKRVTARIATYGKSQQADTNITVEVNSEPVTIFGSTTRIATGATTLEGLAAEYYGDPSLAALIGLFNGITNEDIELGMTLRIPQITRSTQIETNRIYSWDRASNYGTDIRFDPAQHSVELAISEAGDFLYISGKDNIIQAINMRLNERLGKRLRLSVYGLTAAFGSARSNLAPVGYIVTNLEDTLKQDPRVKSITNIKLLGDGDNLQVTFNVSTIEDQILYEGVI